MVHGAVDWVFDPNLAGQLKVSVGSQRRVHGSAEYGPRQSVQFVVRAAVVQLWND